MKGVGCVYFVGGKEDALKYLIVVNRVKKFLKDIGRIRVPLYYQMLYNIQSVTGGTDQTSGECSFGQTIPI